MPGNNTKSRFPAVVIFVFAFAGLFVFHLPLLRLPYFWDEAGYYIPAARDLLLTGSLIPHSTPSNAHPPLVMAYLALWWKLAGYAPVVTRTAMIVVAAFTLTGLFRLAERIANFEVAVAASICTAIYPVFFTQSSLAQVDLAAAALTFWALAAYFSNRRTETVVWFSLAGLAKETAILAPLALFAWEIACPWLRQDSLCVFPRTWRRLFLLIPVVPLAAWYCFHYLRTGFVFGNPEFFRYNVQSTLNPLRIALAVLLRMWHLLGYLGMYVLTLATVLAMQLNPQGERPRIAVGVQFALASMITAYVLFMSVIGGAPLVRYLLPIVPLVIIIFVSTLWRRVRLWWAVISIVVAGFVISLFINPPYGFSLEDNLAYRDYIVLHERAETLLEARYPTARVLTAWPATDELARPFLGYVTRPMRVVQIDNFTVEQIMSAAELRDSFDLALVFSTKYEPTHSLFARWQLWQEWKARFFGFHRDVAPAAAAQLLGARVIYSETRQGQWIGIIQMEGVQEANAASRQQVTRVRLHHQPNRLSGLKMK